MLSKKGFGLALRYDDLQGCFWCLGTTGLANLKAVNEKTLNHVNHMDVDLDCPYMVRLLLISMLDTKGIPGLLKKGNSSQQASACTFQWKPAVALRTLCVSTYGSCSIWVFKIIFLAHMLHAKNYPLEHLLGQWEWLMRDDDWFRSSTTLNPHRLRTVASPRYVPAGTADAEAVWGLEGFNCLLKPKHVTASVCCPEIVPPSLIDLPSSWWQTWNLAKPNTPPKSRRFC